jgi:hypothetical protein
LRRSHNQLDGMVASARGSEVSGSFPQHNRTNLLWLGLQRPTNPSPTSTTRNRSQFQSAGRVPSSCSSLALIRAWSSIRRNRLQRRFQKASWRFPASTAWKRSHDQPRRLPSWLTSLLPTIPFARTFTNRFSDGWKIVTVLPMKPAIGTSAHRAQRITAQPMILRGAGAGAGGVKIHGCDRDIRYMRVHAPEPPAPMLSEPSTACTYFKNGACVETGGMSAPHLTPST